MKASEIPCPPLGPLIERDRGGGRVLEGGEGDGERAPEGC